MGNNVSRNQGQDYRGLVIPDPRFVSTGFSRTDSSVQEANPRPGVPAPATKSGMVLESSGSMDAVATLIPSITLTACYPGMPGIQDGRFSWSPNFGAATGKTMYWDGPTSISRYQTVTEGETHSALTLGGCITLQDNAILVG